MSSQFTVPRDIYYGSGCLDKLKTLKGQKALLVHGPGAVKSSGVLAKAEGFLKAAGMAVSAYEDITEEPSVDSVKKGAAQMTAFAPDWIIAIGGGPAIDAAKAMWAFYEFPDTRFDLICRPYSFPELRTKARFCAIPSAAGTGSEVGGFSVVTDQDNRHALIDPMIAPDVLIADPTIEGAMPSDVCAALGMETLANAIEAYVSTRHSDYTDGLALHAISMIFEWLPKAFRGDKIGCERVYNAKIIAGMAMGNALLGCTRSFAHATGLVFPEAKIGLGCANGIYLPKIIRFNARNAETQERYVDIAKFLGVDAPHARGFVDEMVNMIKTLRETLELPSCMMLINQNTVSEERIMEKMVDFAEKVMIDECTNSNPRKPNKEQLQKLLLAGYFDHEINF